MEAGFARNDFGISSDDYGSDLVGLASLKVGLYDDLTIDLHAEGGGGLVNAGAGAAFNVADLGVASAAASASSNDGKAGLQLYGSFDTRIGPATLNLRSLHTFDGYADLAVTTSKGRATGLPGVIAPGGLFSIEPPRSFDSIGLSVPIELDNSTIGVNLVRYEDANGERSDLLSATYTRPLIENATLFATGFADLNETKTAAFYVGVNMPLGEGVSSSAGVSTKSGNTSFTAEASKSLKQDPDSWGWHVRDHEGSDPHRSAEVAYRANNARVKAGLRHQDDQLRGTVEIEGAIATLGDDIHFANRIDDAFAVVNAGAEGVPVLRENNVVGVTGEDGTLLIPNLRSYQPNKLEIDPMALPLNAEVQETHTSVTPAFRSGIYLDFQVKATTPSAIVVLVDAEGSFLPAGSEVMLAGSSDQFVVGYDGQAFVTGLAASNSVAVTNGQLTCHPNFEFQPQSGQQMTIGPVPCL